MKFPIMELEGAFARSFGARVQRSGSWIIYGESGNGKTELEIQLAKYFTRFAKVLINTLEEGARLTFQMAMGRHSFSEQERRRLHVTQDEMPQLRARLEKPKSPDIVFIDSLQFAGLTKVQYKQFVRDFPNKLFIWISHSEGKKPLGGLGIHVDYNSDVKIHVIGFKGLVKTRYQAGADYIINQAKADELWNQSL